MVIIALVSTKGGSGKSLLAECLAVHAARQGKSVFLVDLDPQQSSAAWWRRRKGPDNPLLIAGRGSVIRVLRQIDARKAEREVMIIDTPGSDLAVIDRAIKAADRVVVVAQPSIKDLEAQGVVGELIDKAGKAEQALYVVNRAPARSPLARHAVEVLQRRSPHPPVIVADRTSYVQADAAGQTGNEIDAKAERDIAALWDAIERIGNDKAG